MTDSPKQSRQTFSFKILFLFIGLILSVLIFKLFEPVFTHSYGWKTLPQSEKTPAQYELEDDEWAMAAQAAQTKLEAMFERTNIPGISAAITIDNQRVWRGVIGYSDLTEKTALSFDSQFRLGSTSKALTSAAIGTLMDQDLVHLTTMMGTIDPTLPEHIKPITLGQALSHRAGIRNYGMCFCFPVWEHWNRQNFSSVRDAVTDVTSSPLIAQPGTHYAYTSLGYNLAGVAIEKISPAADFKSYMSSAIFAPLGMSKTAVEIYGETYPDLSGLYQVDARQYKPAITIDNSIRWPSGGMISTPTDMVQFGGAFLHENIVSQAMRHQLLSVPETGRNSGGDIYAHGWRVNHWPLKNGNSYLTYNHHGTSVGSTSIFAIFPEQNLVISVMMNKEAQSIDELAQFADIILDAFIIRD